MATWGAYFASYVKKPKEDASTTATPATTNDGSQIAAPKAAVKASAVKSAASTDGFQRSNSTAKKLYEIPTEFPKELPQRSTSNAARVAKLFGYAKPPPAEGKLAGVVAEMVIADAKMKEEGKKSEIITSLFGERASIVNDQAKSNEEAKSQDGVRTKETPSSKLILGLPPDPASNAIIVAGEPQATARMDDQAVRVSKIIQPMTPPNQSLPERRGGDTTSAVLETKPNLTIANRATDFAPMPWAKVAEESITQISKKSAGQTKPSISKLDNDIKTMLDTFASQAPMLTSSEPQQPKLQDENTVKYEEVMESKVYTQARIKSFTSQANIMYPPESEPSKLLEKTVASITPSQFQNVTASKTKNDTQVMLDLFASQAQALESFDDKFNENPVPVKSGVEAKNQVKPTSLSRRKESLGLLDYFANQAESTAQEQTQPRSKPLDVIGANVGEKLQPPSSRRNKSLELLDFFASQAMSTISEDKPVSQQGKVQNNASPTLPANDAVKEQVNPSPIAGITRLENDNAAPRKSSLGEQSNSQEKADIATIESDPVTRIRVKSPGRTAVTPAQRIEAASAVSPPKLTSPSKSTSTSMAQSKTVAPPKSRSLPARGSATSIELRAIMDNEDNDIEETTIDFRERFLEYEKQAEQIRLEKEQMELEHERMLEEIAMFQKEADRIAEEEAAMKKFVESLEAERVRDEENEARKRREREARLEAERLERERLEKLERERVENERLERERLAKEEEERLRLAREEEERLRFEAEEMERLAKAEADRVLSAAVEKERREREEKLEMERMAKEEEMRMDAEIEEMRRRKMEARMEEERLAREEVERLNAEMLRYAEEAEADRRLMEEELEREEEERLEAERLEEEERIERERLRDEQEQAEFERQRKDDERFARQQRRAAQEAAERLEYEQEMAEEEARYEEQERRAQMEQRRKDEEQERRAQMQQRRRDEEQERRSEIQRRREEESRYAEQDRLAAGIQRQNEIEEYDSDEEDEIVKAERKIQEAFAGLAKERGQAPPAVPIKRSNTSQVTTQRQQPSRGLMIQQQETDVRVSRNNTVGARPQLPRKDAPVMRGNTTRGRPLIRGGLPSGPRRRD